MSIAVSYRSLECYEKKKKEVEEEEERKKGRERERQGERRQIEEKQY